MRRRTGISNFIALTIACGLAFAIVELHRTRANRKPAPPDYASLPEWPQQEKAEPIAKEKFKSSRVNYDVEYCGHTNGQRMDIYFPVKASSKPGPALLYVHGGRWIHGDKSEGSTNQILELISRGYLVAAVNYRLFDAQKTPHNKFPSMIEDVKCAVRYLRAHAAELRIDPQRFGAWGWSAGGHLVSLLGTSDDSDWPTNANPAPTARIQAVVDMYGPSELALPDYCVKSPCKDIFGSSLEDRKRASPMSYVTGDDPPFLIIQGDSDSLVPPAQSQDFFWELRGRGVEAKLVMVKNAGHMLRPHPQNATISPSKSAIEKMVADFFDQHLKQ